MVECKLPKLDVAGSSPVSRSSGSLQVANPMTVPTKRISQTQKPLICPFCKTNKPSVNKALWPFCSERCKTGDLGAWATETYRVPGGALPDENDPDSESSIPDFDTNDFNS